MRRLMNLFSPIAWPAWVQRAGGRSTAAWLRLVRGRGPLASDALVLTTRGRKSGRQRSTTLVFFDRDGHRYIVAGFAGLPMEPAWYLNLVADPQVTVQIAGVDTACRARLLTTEEADGLWPYLESVFPGFRHFRQRTARRIPIVELIAESWPATSSPAI